MNNILEMIKNEKVEWKKLGDVFSVRTGYTPSKKNTGFWKDGTVDWFTIEDIRDRGRNLDFANVKISESAVKREKFKANSIVLSTIATIGEYALIEVDFVINQQFMVFTLKDEYNNKINMQYVKYFFSKVSEFCKRITRVGNVPTVDNKKVLDFQIPIPSMETQERIVKILDTMVDHFTQLEAELEARNKQYEYYRDKLLSEEYLNKLTKKFGGEVEYLELGDIGEFFGGLSGKNKNDFINGNERFITYKNVFNNISTNICPEDMVKIDSGEKQRVLQCGDIIFTGSSEIEEESGYSSVITEYVSHPLYLNSFCFFLRLNNNDILIPDFSKFLFRSKNIRKQIIKTSSGVTRFNVSKVLMKKIIIPIPPIAVQEHIVSILDSFNKIVTDINEGLPKEIELRHKQYEYYRERLLDFKRDDDE